MTARSSDGRTWALPVGRYLGAPSAADEDVLARATAPVLDAAAVPAATSSRSRAAACSRSASTCRPSRCGSRASAARTSARRRSSTASPAPGTWGTALLLDGNIGIGGRPTALLARLARLLRPGGLVLVELDRPARRAGGTRIRLEAAGAVSDWFGWAHVEADAIGEHAPPPGSRVRETWEFDGRCFACLRR